MNIKFIFKQLVYFYEPYSTAFFIFIHLNNTIKYKVDVWFQDETRVGQQGSITRMWVVFTHLFLTRASKHLILPVVCHAALSIITNLRTWASKRTTSA
jgi:hypothetical protein